MGIKDSKLIYTDRVGLVTRSKLSVRTYERIEVSNIARGHTCIFFSVVTSHTGGSTAWRVGVLGAESAEFGAIAAVRAVPALGTFRGEGNSWEERTLEKTLIM